MYRSLVGSAHRASVITVRHTSSTTPLQSPQELQDILARCAHLNLTERVIVNNLAASASTDKGGYTGVNAGSCEILGRGKVKVALKQLRINTDSEDRPGPAKPIAEGLSTWSKLIHTNVVRLFGFYLSENGLPATVSEWMDNGPVLQFVKDHPQCDVLHLIHGVAEGLEYIHGNNVIHANIRSDNVLVSSSGEAVIRGFDVPRITLKDALLASSRESLTDHDEPAGLRWMAYELINEINNSEHTKESDVWAFGMTVYELLAKERPYASISTEVQVMISVKHKNVPLPPTSFDTWSREKQDVWALSCSCWKHDPKSRISISGVVKALKELRSKYGNEPSESPQDIFDRISNLDITGLVIVDFSRPSIGGGVFSDLHIGSYTISGRDETKTVAIRRMRSDLNGHSTKDTDKDIYAWSRLVHPNIIQLLGFIRDERSLPSTVSEWMENGTVLQYIKSHPSCDVLHLILGIAKGLEYLHKNDVVHADIKSDNVLVSSSVDAVIRGFELPRTTTAAGITAVDCTTLPHEQSGAIRWMAYELITESEKYTKHTKESDVWAFGMTVYELLAKERPYAHVRIENMVIICLMRRELPSRPVGFDGLPTGLKQAWSLCQECWKLEPQVRISMTDAVRKLEALK
ncbi:hypothetical protein M0805_009156 [Coniferiporia weirii]|nr:hypothetical protein M0805_009156 [Coniferiporia weirii]